MATRTDPTFVDPTGDISPGERLRNAREAADLSVKDIATTLRLEPRTIEALESGSFDELPAPTFVRGYLRGYARVVGLPPDPLLDLYERHGFTPPAISPDPVEKSQAHASDLVFRLATFAIGGVLVVLVVLWWNSQDFGVPGIDGDLLDWSSDTAQDASPPDTQRAAAPADSDEADTSAGIFGDLFSEPDETATATPADTTPVIQEPVAGDGSAPAEPEAPAARTETVASVPPGQALFAPAGSGTGSVGDAGTGSTAESRLAAAADTTAETGAASETDGTTETTSTADTGPVSETAGAAEPDAAGAADAGAGTETAADATATAESEPDTASNAVAVAVPAGETRITEVTGAAALPADQPSAETDSTAGSDTDGTADPGGESDAAQDPSTETTASAEESGGATESPDAQPDESESPAARSGEDTASDGSATASALPSVESELVLEFAHESWVEVYDRDRTRLFFGLVSPGRILEFTGPSPFDVLLGFALDARITLDGRVFDHTPFINHGVARFRLEPSGERVSGAPARKRTSLPGPPLQTDESRGP